VDYRRRALARRHDQRRSHPACTQWEGWADRRPWSW
jgi:hypothetical protein